MPLNVMALIGPGKRCLRRSPCLMALNGNGASPRLRAFNPAA
ncbi:hypothetical protein [Novosphingobium sp. B 225]|nr:hypothetical protein [Novosphingobium sp. B 225]